MKRTFIIIFIFNSFAIACQTNVCLCDMVTGKDSLLYHNDTIFTGSYHCFNKGKLTGIGYVTNGIMDSLFSFDNQGNLIQQIFYENKTESYVRQYHNGIISKFVKTFKNGKLDGLWEELTFDGNLLTRRYYRENKPVGLWVEFDRKGNLMIESYFDEEPIITKIYVYKKIFKKRENIYININYYNKNQKLIKRERKEISNDEYLLLSQERKRVRYP